ncbi:MAG: GNAT family N-acetyltransferase [Micromonosporaceae bacterium]
MSASVRNNAGQQRYEVCVDGTVAGFAAYRLRPETVVFTHTEIDPAYEGRGLGSQLARGALDDVRGAGKRVLSLCPFIAGYIERHPEYGDLVVHEQVVHEQVVQEPPDQP